MGTKNKVLIRIYEKYALLKITVQEYPDILPIVRALLPLEAEEGIVLRYENFCYKIVEQ